MPFYIIIIIIIIIINYPKSLGNETIYSQGENYPKGLGNETIYSQGSPLIINKYIYIKDIKYFVYLNLLSRVDYCIKQFVVSCSFPQRKQNILFDL